LPASNNPIINNSEVPAYTQSRSLLLDPNNEFAVDWGVNDDEDICVAADEGYVISNSSVWLSDTGTLTHLVNQCLYFSEYRAEPCNIDGIVPGTPLCAYGVGTVPVEFLVENKIIHVNLENVRYTPDATNTIVSVGRLIDAGYKARFNKGSVKFLNTHGIKIADSIKKGQVYQMKMRPSASIPVPRERIVMTREQMWDKWNHALGHISMGAVHLLYKKGLVEGMKVNELSKPAQCTACIQGKHATTPYPTTSSSSLRLSSIIALQIGDLMRTDVWGLAPTLGIGCEWFYYAFTD